MGDEELSILGSAPEQTPTPEEQQVLLEPPAEVAAKPIVEVSQEHLKKLQDRAKKASTVTDVPEIQLRGTFQTENGEDAFNNALAAADNEVTVIRNEKDLFQFAANGQLNGASAGLIENLLNRDVVKLPLNRFDPYWEAKYSKQMMATTLNASGILAKYGEDIKDEVFGVKAIKDGFQKTATLREAFLKIAEQEDEYARDRSYTRAAIDLGLQVVPGVSWYSTTRPELYQVTKSILPGSSVQEQIMNIYNIGQTVGLDAAVAVAKQSVEAIRQVSPNDAREFAHLLRSFTDGDKYMFNLLGLADALTVAELAKPTGKAVLSLAGTLGSAFKATGRGVLSGIGLLDASGAVEKAALANAWTNFKIKTTAGGMNVTDINQIEKSVISLSNVNAAVSGGRFLAREASRRIEDAMVERGGELLNLASRSLDTGALDSSAITRTALNEAADTARRLYQGMGNSVVDVRLISAQETVSGFDAAAILVGKPTLIRNPILGTVTEAPIREPDVAITIARKDATPFDSIRSATKAATDIYKLDKFDIVQHGSKYVIEIRRPLDMTATPVRAAIAEETKNVTPKSLFTAYMGALRNRDFVNSPQLTKDLKVALYGGSGMQQEFGRLVEKAFGDTRVWRKEDLGNFERFLEAQRDVVISGVRGKFSRNIGEFETDWKRMFGVTPKEHQANAYFAYQQFNDLDYVFRNILEHSTRVRQGRELFAFNMDNYKMKKGMVEGKFLKDGIPWHLPEHANVIVWNENSVLMKLSNAQRISTKYANAATRAAYDDLVQNQGYRVVQISTDGERMMRSIPQINDAIGAAKVDYVLVRDARTSPLPLNILPYRAGGHVRYDPEGYVLRQPILTRSRAADRPELTYYSGDRSLLHFRDRKEGLVYVEHMNKIRTLLNDPVALEAYRSQHLGHIFSNTRDIRKVFHERGGQFNPNEAFTITKMDQSIDQAGGLMSYVRTMDDTVINTNTSLHNLDRGKPHVSFTTERDLDINGVYHGLVEPARKLDPMATMIMANNSLMRGRYMEDFKVKQAERFISEFGHLIDGVKNKEELWANPLVHLTTNAWKAGAPAAELAAAKNMQYSIRSLLGQKTAFQEHMDTLLAGVSEAYFHAMGDKGYKHVTNVLEMPLISNPTAFVRAAAFYPKMGFFNPAQFFVQAQTLGVVTAVAGPVTATQAMRGYASMKMASLTNKPQVLDHLAKIAGWDPAHFKEALQGIHSSGFANVGREFSDMSDVLKQGSLKTTTGKFLDAGLGFFKEGERTTRFAAWNSAYLEWRKANPTAKYDAAAQANILKRADDMTVNMSNASDSRISRTTLGSMMGQFLQYQVKLNENILSGMITGKGAFNRTEAAKVAMMQTALYGVPVGLMGSVAGTAYPWYEQVKEYLFKNGINTDDNEITKVLNDGLLGVMTELATGTKYNVAERYGSGGINLFKDLLTGDPKQFERAILGAGAKNMYDFFKNASPLMASMSNAAHGNYLMTAADIQEAFKSITTVNSAIKVYYAMNLGKLVTRNEGHFGDITTTEAVTGLITGLMPQRFSDAYLKLEWERDRKEGLKHAEEQATINFRRAAEALARGDYDQHEKLTIRAQVFLDATDMTIQERAAVIRRASNNMTDLVDKVDEQVSRRTPEAYQQWLKRMDRRVRPNAHFDPEGN